MAAHSGVSHCPVGYLGLALAWKHLSSFPVKGSQAGESHIEVGGGAQCAVSTPRLFSWWNGHVGASG